MSILLFIYLAYQSHLASCTPTASPSSSDPNPLTHLVYGCLATVFMTSWAAVHPNVPAQNATWARRAIARAELMAWTVLAPELVVMMAVHQWFAANEVAAKYRNEGWTMTHGFFLHMGGFMLVDGSINTGVISPRYFKSLMQENKIALPEVTLQEIRARSHPDGLACSAAALQTLWFVTQLGAKIHTRGREAVLQLELATLAITILNWFVFAFWWSKPRDVRVPVEVSLLRPTSAPGTSNLEKAELKAEKSVPAAVQVKKTWKTILSNYIIMRILTFGHNDDLLPSRPSVPTFLVSHIPRRLKLYAYFVTLLLGLLFGALHCAAWDLAFPSHAESLLWRISSVIMVAYLAVFFLLLLPELVMGRAEGGSPPTEVDRWLICFERFVLWPVGMPIYVAARLFVILEVFLALRMHNVTAAVESMVSWTGALPHI